MGKSEKIKRKRRHQSPSESDSSVEDNDETARKRHRKSSHKNFTKEKHTQSVLSDSSTNSSSLSSSSTSDSEDEKRKHHKKRTKKDKKSKHKKKLRKKEKKKKHKKSKKKRNSTALCSPLHAAVPETKLPKKTRSGEKSTAKKTDADSCGRMFKPLTKEEWEKQQAVLHREYDPETGRNRLVRGDGEIVEEIVSKERHKEINKQATAGDGIFYQMKAGLHK